MTDKLGGTPPDGGRAAGQRWETCLEVTPARRREQVIIWRRARQPGRLGACWRWTTQLVQLELRYLFRVPCVCMLPMKTADLSDEADLLGAWRGHAACSKQGLCQAALIPHSSAMYGIREHTRLGTGRRGNRRPPTVARRWGDAAQLIRCPCPAAGKPTGNAGHLPERRGSDVCGAQSASLRLVSQWCLPPSPPLKATIRCQARQRLAHKLGD